MKRNHSGLILVLMALVLTFFSCSGAVKSPDTTMPQEPGSNPEITAADILRHIKTLASDEMNGRRTGTPGGDMAAEYIVGEFKRFGLTPIDETGDYKQPFEFLAGAEMGEGNVASAVVGGDSLDFELKTEYLPLAFSSSGEVTGDVVFAGYGITFEDKNYDDYAGIDVEGKIVIVMRFHPESSNPHVESEFVRFRSNRYKSINAREKGAVAILFVTGPVDADSVDKTIRFNKETRFADSGILALSITRATADRLLAPTGKTLKELQDKIVENVEPNSMVVEGTSLSVNVNVHSVYKWGANIIGLVEGSDPVLKDEVIIIGGHYDHLGIGGASSRAPEAYGEVHNGADDNASGTAGVLEIAQYIVAHRDEIKHSFLFQAYAAEEVGLIGSAYYVENPLLPLENTVAMFNMDMIGRGEDTSVVANGIGTSPIWETIVDKANENIGLKLNKKQSGSGSSDHASFNKNEIPVMFFFTGVHDDYHRPSDDWEKINANTEELIVRYVRNLALLLDAETERPEYVKAEGERDQQQMSFRVTLGITPDYVGETEGLKVTGVSPGGAAEKYGVLKDDIIIKMGDKSIKNIYDYMYALQSFNPGQEIVVTVKRGEEEVEINVIMQGGR